MSGSSVNPLEDTMKIKRYDEIQSGDIGRFATDEPLFWIATGPFEPYEDGSGWGVIPIVSNERLKKDRVGYLQGKLDTETRTYELV